MGVQGLASLLERHPRVYREVRFGRSRLVVDGSNLVHLLYFSSGLDQNHGGEYAAFKAVTERFISALQTCDIMAYVVLDGGSDVADKKLKTVTRRAEDRIRRAHWAAVSGEQKNILPPLAKQVFRQTLIRLGVAVAQCFGEADQEIAALASEWSCPVLSNDSDFFIFELQAGLLPLTHFLWEGVQQSGGRSYIPCKRYYASSFCIYFQIQRQLLTAFAALAGNDYVKLQRIDWTQFSLPNGEPPSRLEGLLHWLRNFHDPHQAVEAALGLMRAVSGEAELSGLSLGMKEYQLPASSLKRFFIHGVVPSLPAEEPGGPVPDWTLLPLTQARLTADVLDVLRLRRMDLGVTVEHRDLPSTNATSRPIRQVMYGLLLGRGTSLRVDERDRDGVRLKILAITPTLSRTAERLQLHPLHQAVPSDEQAAPSEPLQVLLEALGVTEARLDLILPELRLPVAITCYWLQRAQPRPDVALLKALLLGMSSGATMRAPECSQARKQHRKQKPDVGVAHALSQWQVCLKDSIHLNQLLGFPLPEPEISRLYQGTLVHQLVHRIRAGLKCCPSLDTSGVQQYGAMLSIVQCFNAQVSIERRCHLDDLTADLRQLFLLHEDDEEAEVEARGAIQVQEELQLNERVWVRTRYTTKQRRNRCNRPELSRKEENRRRGLL